MINQLYQNIKNGRSSDEEKLFSALSERFRLFLQYKIRDIEDRDDVIQETLKAIALKYKSVELEVKFSSWAYGVLEKSVLHFYRTEANRQKKENDFENSQSRPSGVTPDPNMKIMLEKCFRKLCLAHNRYARILNLHYNGYKVEEICQKLALTRNNIYIILSRGRSLLRECLKSGELK